MSMAMMMVCRSGSSQCSSATTAASRGRRPESGVCSRTLLVMVGSLLLAAQLRGVVRGDSYCRLKSSAVCVGSEREYNQTGIPLTPHVFKYGPIVIDVLSVTFGAGTVAGADLNGDGLVDLVTEVAWSYLTPESFLAVLWNKGTATDPKWVVSENASMFEALHGAEGNRSAEHWRIGFGDLDGDLDQDMVACYQNESIVALYENVGTTTEPNFALWPLERGGYINQELPCRSAVIADLDSDGLLDVMVGSSRQPKAIFLQNQADSASTTPVLVDVTGSTSDPFADTVFGEFEASSSIALDDHDNDGDLDALIAVNGLSMYENTGSAAAPEWTSVTLGSPVSNLVSTFQADAQVLLIDATNDGVAELFFISAFLSEILYYVSHQTISIVELGTGANPLSVPSDLPAAAGLSTACSDFGDMDGDGDLDIIVMNLAVAAVYENDQVNISDVMSFPKPTVGDASLSNSPPRLVDLDGDGVKPELVLGFWDSFDERINRGLRVLRPPQTGGANPLNISLYEIDPVLQEAFQEVSNWSNLAPAFGDLDSDGDFDLVLGSFEGPFLATLENTGNASDPYFEVSDFGHLGNGDLYCDFTTVSCLPALGDLTGDGLLDLAAGQTNGQIHIFLNEGSLDAPVFALSTLAELTDTTGGAYAAPTIVDIDNDGAQDLVVGDTVASLAVFMNGRCFQNAPCSGNGGCLDLAISPACTCFTGKTDDQCNACSTGFYGESCELCPGAGDLSSISLTNICSQRGTCVDGITGSGNCTCNSPFYGGNCDEGECPAGTELVLNETTLLFECEECASGTFKADAGNDELCEACPAGTFANSTGATACEDCPAGSSGDRTGQTACTLCAVGTYVGSTRATTCLTCDSNNGFTSKSAGSTTCSACLRGYYWDSSAAGGNGSCVDCEDSMDCKGSFSTLQGLVLKSGYWRTSVASDTVEECPFDGACAGGNGSDDALCNTGYEGPLCAVCSDDYYYDKGVNKCVECGSGNLSATTAIVIAIACLLVLAVAKRYLSNTLGQSKQVVPVVIMPQTDDDGAVSTAAIATTATPTANTTAATTTIRNRAAKPQPHPSRGTLETPITGDASTAALQTWLREQSSRHGHRSSERTRIEHRRDGKEEDMSDMSLSRRQSDERHVNRRSEKKRNKYGEQRNPCSHRKKHGSTARGAKLKKSTEGVDASALASVGAENPDTVHKETTEAAVLAEEDATKENASSGLQKWRTKLKILTTFFQIVSSFPFVLDIEFPELFGASLEAFSVVNLDFVQVLPVDCISEQDYVDELMWMTLAPLVLSAVLGLLWLFHTKGRLPYTMRDRDPDQLRTAVVTWTGFYAGLELLLTFLVFPSVSAKVFRMFSCQEFDDGSSYLRSDYSIDCRSSRYTFGAAWAGVMVLVYPVGIPLLYFVLLYRAHERINPSERAFPSIAKRAAELVAEDEKLGLELAMQVAKAEHREEDESLLPISFLFEDYESRVWYFEVLESLRRLVLSAMLVFLFEGTAAQIVIAMLIALGSIEMYAKLEPYLEDSDDLVAEVVQFQIFMVLFGALLIRVDVTADDAQSQLIFGVVLILISVTAPIIVIIAVVVEIVVGCRNNLNDALDNFDSLRAAKQRLDAQSSC